MYKTDAPNHSGNQYTNGDPGLGILPTQIADEHMNAIQNELSNAVEGAGLSLNKVDSTQLFQAIGIIGGGGVAGKIPAGAAFPGTPAGNDLFYRNDQNIFYMRNNANSAWMAIRMDVSKTLSVKAAPSGDLEFSTVQAAIDFLKICLIPPGILATIDIESGAFVSASEISLKNLSRIKIVGDTIITKTITSCDSIAGGGGAYDLQYTLSDTTSLAIGDYVLFRGTTGADHRHGRHAGFWEIVGLAGSQITVRNTYKHPSLPPLVGDITGGSVDKIPSVLKGTAGASSAVIRQEGGDVLFSDIAIVPVGGTEKGLWIQKKAISKFQGTVGINGDKQNGFIGLQIEENSLFKSFDNTSKFSACGFSLIGINIDEGTFRGSDAELSTNGNATDGISVVGGFFLCGDLRACGNFNGLSCFDSWASISPVGTAIISNNEDFGAGGTRSRVSVLNSFIDENGGSGVVFSDGCQLDLSGAEVKTNALQGVRCVGGVFGKFDSATIESNVTEPQVLSDDGSFIDLTSGTVTSGQVNATDMAGIRAVSLTGAPTYSPATGADGNNNSRIII